ncbi:MAG TPA: phage holin family protein [Thermoanaerobaculia bacterium]|nr:phage holin family protein [Thermoanaerobaculia bacterium]
MAVLQAILALVSRSAGKIFSALLGWAVLALFGRTSEREQAWLSALLAAAAAWPLLVVGIVAPKLAALVLAFVPLPRSVPTSAVRLGWIFLALAVPVVVGIVFANRSPRARHEPALKRLARGFPITVALAGAFLVLLVSTPFRKLVAVLKGLRDDTVPLSIEPGAFDEVVRISTRVLDLHGFSLRREEPTFWMKAPTAILASLGGDAFGAEQARIRYFRAPDLDATVTMHGVSLRGPGTTTSRAHGLIAEAMTRTDALQSMDPVAQAIERRIKDVWKAFGTAHRARARSFVLTRSLEGIAEDIVKLPVGYDDWQVVYRQALQLSRVLSGQRQLLEGNDPENEEGSMEGTEATLASTTRPLETVPLGALFSGAVVRAERLLQEEAELAKTELREDLRAELKLAKDAGIALLTAVSFLQMLLVAVVLALARTMPGWAAALLVSAPLLVLTAVFLLLARAHKVTAPLRETRRSLEETFQWVRNRFA